MNTAIILRPESTNPDFPEFTFFVAKDREEFEVLSTELFSKVRWITKNEDYLDDTPLTLENMLSSLGYNSLEEFNETTQEEFTKNCIRESTPLQVSSLMI